MTTVRITYFGMEGEGPTLTKAKLDAGAKIEKALNGSWTPEIFAHRGYAYLVYREPDGWHDRLIAYAADGIKPGPVYGNSHPDAEKQSVVRHVLSHLAQLGWTAEDGLTPPAFLKDRSDIHDYQRHAEFQLRYQEGRRRGIAEKDLHSYAGRDPGRPELYAEEDKQTAAVA